jgi:transglutaminase-like putative cysteine protease
MAAKDRVRTGAVPEWVVECPFDIDFKPKSPGQLIHLLFEQQIHAELGQTYFHRALRLETAQAVRSESPLRLDFEPRHQRIIVHWIKTWRAGVKIDHTNLSSARMVDRQPAGSTLDRVSILLMLEDVRPGDVLEWAYSVKSQPLLLPEYCAAMFTLPAGVAVGKFYFSLRFDPSRPMQWKSSEPEWIPVEKQEDEDTLWVWSQDKYPGLQPEENTPDWDIPHPWVQISDFEDWGIIAAGFAEAWEESDDDPAVAEIAAEIAGGKGSILEQAERAIQLVQDEYRYLAIDWELDGQPPVPPGVVARRRYGDGKDLSFLLAHLLKRLGVQARLVLVNTVFRKSVAELLPAPQVFNHLLVEYEARGETRWVDATLKHQGGGSLKGFVRDYGAGLPVDSLATDLVEQPKSAQGSVYELRESILLDTSGAWSWFGVVVAASGSHAEALRAELENEGLEALSKKRLRLCADRFIQARRLGPLEYRDDRAANQFFLAEIFEIKDFLTLDPKSKWHKLDLPNDYAVSLLKTPYAGPRRTPFALPHPCNIIHTIELHSVALPPAVVQQRSIDSEFLHFTRHRKTLAGYWTMKLTFSTLADAVPPDALDQHRKAMREIREQSAWSILVPAGDPRPHQRGDFSALPTAWEPDFTMPAPSKARPRGERRTPVAPLQGHAASRNIGAAPGLATGKAKPARAKWRKRSRRKRNPERMARKVIIWACASALLLILIVALVAKNADRWHVFKMRPKPPSPADFSPDDDQ